MLRLAWRKNCSHWQSVLALRQSLTTNTVAAVEVASGGGEICPLMSRSHHSSGSVRKHTHTAVAVIMTQEAILRNHCKCWPVGFMLTSVRQRAVHDASVIVLLCMSVQDCDQFALESDIWPHLNKWTAKQKRLDPSHKSELRTMACCVNRAYKDLIVTHHDWFSLKCFDFFPQVFVCLKRKSHFSQYTQYQIQCTVH